MVVLEAMAAGVPVVGSRVEGVPEAIDDGINGLLAHPGDAADLAEKLQQVIDGELDWELLRENAMQTYLDDFSDCGMAEGVAKVYRAILAT